MPAPAILLPLRHIGGDVRAVNVEEATMDGCLHVRWESFAGVYVVKVFKGGGLYRTRMAREWLQWTALDGEEAKALWRRMTGRECRVTYRPVWRDGRRIWVPK